MKRKSAMPPAERKLRRALKRALEDCDRHVAGCYTLVPRSRERLRVASDKAIRLAEQLEGIAAGAYRCADDPRLAALIFPRAANG